MSVQTHSKKDQIIRDLRDSVMSVTIGVPVAVAEMVADIVKKTTGARKGSTTTFRCSTTGREHADLDDAMAEADGLVRAQLTQLRVEHPNAYIAVRVNEPSRVGVTYAVTTQVTIAHGD